MCQAQALPSKITNLWPDHPIDRIVIANIQNIETGFGEDFQALFSRTILSDSFLSVDYRKLQ